MWLTSKSEAEVPTLLPEVSIIIIARNEEKNIINCLQSIAANNYPTDRYEIILVDDHSEDQTVELACSIGIANLTVLALSQFNHPSFQNFHKKAGQLYAIREARYELILQTDADCICPSNWIKYMTKACFRKDIVTGPIHISGGKRILENWQTFECIGVMASTYMGIRLGLWYSANAGNMIFRKEVFSDFIKNASHNSASGDDIFLINWVAENHGKIGFAKSAHAIVSTKGETNYSEFYQQRLRWSGKTTAYSSIGLKWLMASLFLFHLLIITSGLCAFFAGIQIWKCFILLMIVKWIGDSILLVSIAPFYSVRYPILMSPVFSFLHTIYIVVFGISGLLNNSYRWKGRSVS